MNYPTLPDEDHDFTPELARQIIALYQQDAERIRAALEDAAQTMRNVQGHIESGQVVDKESHRTLVCGRSRALAALAEKDK